MAPGKKKSGKDAASKASGPPALLSKIREAKNKGGKHLRKYLDERCSEPSAHYLLRAYRAHLLLSELEDRQRSTKDKKSAQDDLRQALQLAENLDKPGDQFSILGTEVKISALEEQWKETNQPDALIKYIEEFASRGVDAALYIDPKHEQLEDAQGGFEGAMSQLIKRAADLHTKLKGEKPFLWLQYPAIHPLLKVATDQAKASAQVRHCRACHLSQASCRDINHLVDSLVGPLPTVRDAEFHIHLF
jgi:hypothetical protein